MTIQWHAETRFTLSLDEFQYSSAHRSDGGQSP